MKVVYIILVILAIIISYFVGYSAGYSAGAYKTLDWVYDKAQYFLILNNLSLDINKGMILDGIFRYKESIGGCWDIVNLSKKGVINAFDNRS